MKKINLVLGALAFIAAITLNVRHALNDYGVSDNKLHLEVLADTTGEGESDCCKKPKYKCVHGSQPHYFSQACPGGGIESCSGTKHSCEQKPSGTESSCLDGVQGTMTSCTNLTTPVYALTIHCAN
jgi:hypothetical protein